MRTTVTTKPGDRRPGAARRFGAAGGAGRRAPRAGGRRTRGLRRATRRGAERRGEPGAGDAHVSELAPHRHGPVRPHLEGVRQAAQRRLRRRPQRRRRAGQADHHAGHRHGPRPVGREHRRPAQDVRLGLRAPPSTRTSPATRSPSTGTGCPPGIERWRQKVYGVPYWASPTPSTTTRRLFKQKGVEDPWARSRNQGDWTLEEMVDARPPGQRPGQRRVGPGLGPGQPQRDRAPDLDAGRLPRAVRTPRSSSSCTLPEVVEAHDLGPRLDDAPADQRAAPGAGGRRGARRASRPAGRRSTPPGAPTSSPLGRIGIHWRSAVDWQRMWPRHRHRLRVGHAPRAQHQGQARRLADRQPPPQRLGEDEAPGRRLGLHEVDDPGRVPGLPGRAPATYVPAKRSHQARFFRVAEPVPATSTPRSSPTSTSGPSASLWGRTTTRCKNMPTYATEMPKLYRGEVPMQAAACAELNRLLNQEIDYGGGENPFKGMRWPHPAQVGPSHRARARAVQVGGGRRRVGPRPQPRVPPARRPRPGLRRRLPLPAHPHPAGHDRPDERGGLAFAAEMIAAVVAHLSASPRRRDRPGPA